MLEYKKGFLGVHCANVLLVCSKYSHVAFVHAITTWLEVWRVAAITDRLRGCLLSVH